MGKRIPLQACGTLIQIILTGKKNLKKTKYKKNLYKLVNHQTQNPGGGGIRGHTHPKILNRPKIAKIQKLLFHWGEEEGAGEGIP